VAVTPREQWREAYRALGFSERAADSYARMTAASLDEGFDEIEDPISGDMTIEDYISGLVARAS
jgi:hypothetical protein